MMSFSNFGRLTGGKGYTNSTAPALRCCQHCSCIDLPLVAVKTVNVLKLATLEAVSVQLVSASNMN